MEQEPTEDKELLDAVNKLDTDQREVFDNAIQQRREELVADSGIRNVPVSERWEILEGVKDGSIKPVGKSTPILPGVDMGKVERDFDAAGEPSKGAK